MKQLIVIIIIFLGISCTHKNEEYKVVYEISYPDRIYKDSLITYHGPEFSVDYFENSYRIIGDNIFILRSDKYPIFIKNIQKLN